MHTSDYRKPVENYLSIMFILHILLLSIATLHTACGIKPFGNNGRIIGGSDIDITHAPWQVSLQERNYFFCGGSLYSRNIVITAAHCLAGKTTRYIAVRVGSSEYSRGGSVIPVSKFITHERYRENPVRNDVAVVLLNSPIQLNRQVRAIPLATTEPAVGTTATATGWGQTSFSSISRVLQSVNVNIIGRDRCNRDYAKSGVSVAGDAICAAAPGRDACQGDSGGPLVSQGQLLGIVSWGQGCAHPLYPGVYASIPALRSWIISAVNKIT